MRQPRPNPLVVAHILSDDEAPASGRLSFQPYWRQKDRGHKYMKVLPVLLAIVATVVIISVPFWYMYMVSGGQRYKVSLLYYPLNAKDPSIERTYKKIIHDIASSNPLLMRMASSGALPGIDDLQVYHAEILLTSRSGVRTKLMFTDSGIREYHFEAKPNPIWQAPKELELGTFAFDKETFIDSIPGKWNGSDYHLFERNCVDFADTFCKHIGTLDKYEPIAMRKVLLESTKGQVDIFKAASTVKTFQNLFPDVNFTQVMNEICDAYNCEVPAMHTYQQS